MVMDEYCNGACFEVDGNGGPKPNEDHVAVDEDVGTILPDVVPCYSGSSKSCLTFNNFSDILGILRGLESLTSTPRKKASLNPSHEVPPSNEDVNLNKDEYVNLRKYEDVDLNKDVSEDLFASGDADVQVSSVVISVDLDVQALCDGSLIDLFAPPVLHFINSRCSAPSQLHLPAINSDLHPSASDAVASILASDAASTSAAVHALHFLKVVYFPVLGKVFFTFPALELDY
ncbi:hypothetical protein LXL04_002705 [Taraxacum kok-saghyz]